jgi:hypothetical protein
MNVQCLDLKVPVAQPEQLDPGTLIPVFHRWVREQVGEGLLIDVADYRHVHAGPGVVLVGHEGNYSLDMAGGRPGLRYIRKTHVEGGLQGALDQSLRALNAARMRLEAEPAFAGRLRFDTRTLEIRINDRLLAPNLPETFAALQPGLARYFESRAGPAHVRISYLANSRETFGVAVHSTGALLPETEP